MTDKTSVYKLNLYEIRAEADGRKYGVDLIVEPELTLDNPQFEKIISIIVNKGRFHKRPTQNYPVCRGYLHFMTLYGDKNIWETTTDNN